MKPLDPQTAQKKARMVNALNSGILSIFGFFFFAKGLQEGTQNQERIFLLLIGILFLIFGIFRARMIRKLMKEVDEIDEETYQALTKEETNEQD